jgi:molecular chaperone GrpE (heat shock protein)
VPNAQAIVNAIQFQRNVALDNCATLTAELEETKEELKVANAEIEHLHKQLEDMVKTQLPDTSGVPIA